MISLDMLIALQSPAGVALLAELATADVSDANTLRLLSELRKHHPVDIAAAALETTRLRLKGREKFGAAAERMFFTREALEQATDSRVSRERFGWLSHDDQEQIVDLGCGIGGDSWVMAQLAGHVLGIDRDPLRLAMAHVNVPAAQFMQADLARSLPFSAAFYDRTIAFFDPARRTSGRSGGSGGQSDRRVFSVKDYVPSLDVVRGWPFRRILVKLSPGVDLAELDAYGGALDFISLNGDLKEATLSLGMGETGRHAIVIRSSADSTVSVTRFSRTLVAPDPPVSEPRGYLYEPDAAVIRAGLVQDLAISLDASLIDPTIAYLTADTQIATPLARSWTIEAWLPFNLKKLRAYLRERNVGRVTVKKRGSPLTPEELIAKLHLPNDGDERVIVLTRVRGNPAIIICQPL